MELTLIAELGGDEQKVLVPIPSGFEIIADYRIVDVASKPKTKRPKKTRSEQFGFRLDQLGPLAEWVHYLSGYGTLAKFRKDFNQVFLKRYPDDKLPAPTSFYAWAKKTVPPKYAEILLEMGVPPDCFKVSSPRSRIAVNPKTHYKGFTDVPEHLKSELTYDDQIRLSQGVPVLRASYETEEGIAKRKRIEAILDRKNEEEKKQADAEYRKALERQSKGSNGSAKRVER